MNNGIILGIMAGFVYLAALFAVLGTRANDLLVLLAMMAATLAALVPLVGQRRSGQCGQRPGDVR